MQRFTWNEMADMHLAYGAAGGNALAARRIYADRHPERVIPSHPTFASIDRRLREEGSFKINKHDTGRARSVCTVEFDKEVLRYVEENPSASTRSIANLMGVDRGIIWNVLHEEKLHPFHLQKVQALLPGDFPARAQFARWFLEKRNERDNFAATILFTDEASFTREGIFNSRNNHIWAENNPHGMFKYRHQQRFSVNVWAGIVNDSLIGPYLLPTRLNAQNYLLFLQQVLPELLEDVPLNVRRDMWFQHDGTAAHYAGIVHLTVTFGERWIGRRGPVSTFQITGLHTHRFLSLRTY